MEAKLLQLTTADGVQLMARQWSGGDAWVVLSSNGDGRSERWRLLAEALSDRDLAVLTYEWRGTNPDIPGQSEWTLALTDAQAALAYARAHSAKRLVLVGGSLGSIASVKLGAGKDIVGVVVISTPYRLSG